jgi:hypothetical protein
MEDADPIAAEMAEHSADNPLANLTPEQVASIRQRVLEGIAEEERGEYTEYVGRAGLKQLVEDIKARGHERMLSLKTGQDRENSE